MRTQTLLTALALSGVLALPAAAQDVGLAVGARVGYPWGLSLKAFLTDEIAAEGILGFQPYFGSRYSSFDVRFGGFYHYDLELDDEGFEPLQLMFGATMGLRFWNYDDDFFGPGLGRFRDDYSETTFGIRGHLGAQYAFEDIPLELTFDIGPSLGFGDLWINAFGFHSSAGVRYIISRR